MTLDMSSAASCHVTVGYFQGTAQVLKVQVKLWGGRELSLQARAETLQIRFTAWFCCECFSRSHTIT